MIYILPTQMEAVPLRRAMPDVQIEICGVGLAAAAAAISKIIAQSHPSQTLVLCGIAGSYNLKRVNIGEVVEVIEESIEELPERFRQSYKVEATTQLKSARSNSVNSSQKASNGQDIENMEGASFMALCRAHSRRGVQIRAISNLVGDSFEKWRVDEALENLANTLKESPISDITPYKLAISPCPNDTFIFDALINRGVEMDGMNFEVEYHDIDHLNDIAQSGEVDFIKVSAAAIPILYRDYRVCESGSALGWGNGPLVVRRPESRDKPMRRVAVPGLSTTATLLLRRYFPQVEQVEVMLFSQIASAVERGQVDGGVLIHEGRFTYMAHNLELVADLGKLWEQELSMPLPLGVILMRRDIDITIQRNFERLVAKSLEEARSREELSNNFIISHAQEMDKEVIHSHINLFVNEFSHSLGDRGVEAIEQLTGLDRALFM